MTDTIVPQSAAAPATPGLVARIVGVLVSPRATYARIAERPRAVGVLVVVTLAASAALFAFLSTDVGTKALMDSQLARMEAIGRPMSDANYERFEQMAPVFRYIVPGTILFTVPLVTLLTAAAGLAVFNAALGGNASFKQVFGVVAHANVLVGLQTLFALPLNYATASLTSSSTLAVFFPMLDDMSFLGRLLGQIDLFRIWWVVSMAIGFGVLYQRRTSPIAWTFLGVYVLVALFVAGLMTALSGA